MLGKENVRGGFFGQEINLTTYNLCRISMFLHDINFADFSIAHGDTLTDRHTGTMRPSRQSSPTRRTRRSGSARTIRLSSTTRASPQRCAGPEVEGDLAFTMHMLSWLAVDGTAAIVEFPGCALPRRRGG